MSETYKLIFHGKLQPDFTKELVEANFLQHTKLPPEKVQSLLSANKPVTLVSNLSIEDAEKKNQFFKKLGICIQVVAEKKTFPVAEESSPKDTIEKATPLAVKNAISEARAGKTSDQDRRQICTDCQYSVEVPADSTGVERCPKCGNTLRIADIVDQMNYKAAEEDTAWKSFEHTHALKFKATGGEYFRIWIVNTLLSLMTLSLYSPWAKVRNRQYLYSNMSVEGHGFHYHADPKAILKGRLLVYAILGTIIVTWQFSPEYALLLFIPALLLFPYLAYKAHRFAVHNTSWRNIRFRFWGTVKGAYKAFMLYAPLSLIGLFYHIWAYQRKKYFFSNLALGTARSNFEFDGKGFFGIFFFGGFLYFVFKAIFQFPLIGLASFLSRQGQVSMASAIETIAVLAVPVIFLAVVQQYIYAKTTALCLNETSLGEVAFKCHWEGGQLMWIRFTNILMIIFTAGLAAPWATVRRIRYLTENLEIRSKQGVDSIAATSIACDSATGDAALEAIDFEFGF